MPLPNVKTARESGETGTVSSAEIEMQRDRTSGDEPENELGQPPDKSTWRRLHCASSRVVAFAVKWDIRGRSTHALRLIECLQRVVDRRCAGREAVGAALPWPSGPVGVSLPASGCGLAGKARALGARDRGFESHRPDHPLYDAAGADAEPKTPQAGAVDVVRPAVHARSRWLSWATRRVQKPSRSLSWLCRQRARGAAESLGQ